MNFRTRTLAGTCAMLLSLAAASHPIIANGATAGVEELTRGPVHEAFAESVNYDPEPGQIVSTQPPSPIEELAPDQQPVGTNVAWIPGYWSWDDDSSEFIWLSGIWRDLPPGRQWIPGYWAAVGSEWQWTSGYWEDESNQEVVYLPKPPKSIEAGPSAKSTSDNQVWVSGNWMYNEDRYAWRPGYWENAREDWIWIPAHYQWTRRGYVFVEGYWDYDIGRRGTIFAPVRFQRDVYSRDDYYYTPTTAIVLNVFINHLFIRPRYSHYYFGDYYEPRYRDKGYFAPYAYQSNRGGYDPIYVHNRWQHRDDRNWDRERRESFEFYRDNDRQRPPRTFAALAALTNEDRKGRRDQFNIAEPLSRYAENTDGDKSRRRFQKIDQSQRDRFTGQTKELRGLSDSRRQMEARQANRDGDDQKPAAPVREKAIRSPFAGKRIDQLTGKDAPPARPQARQQRGDGNDNQTADRKSGPEAPGKLGMDRKPGPDVAGPAREGEPRDKTPGTKPGTPETASREAGGNTAERNPARGKPEPNSDPAAPNRGPEKNPPSEMNKKDRPSSPQRPQGKPEPAPQRPTQREPENPTPTPNKARVPQGKPEVEEVPRNDRKAEPTPQKKVEPQAPRRSEPKAEPTPQRKAEPQAPRRAEPRAEPAPQPKPQPRPQPQPTRQQAPSRPQPQPAPRKEQPKQTAPAAPQRAEPNKAPTAGPGAAGGHGRKNKD